MGDEAEEEAHDADVDEERIEQQDAHDARLGARRLGDRQMDQGQHDAQGDDEKADHASPLPSPDAPPLSP